MHHDRENIEATVYFGKKINEKMNTAKWISKIELKLSVCMTMKILKCPTHGGRKPMCVQRFHSE